MTADGSGGRAMATTLGPAAALAPATDGHLVDRAGLDDAAALVEASRCLLCFDAPCIGACPTHIDVPAFIRRISTGDLVGSARTILAANPLGGTCARVCPVERLCEGACIRGSLDGPVAIGRLQRYAIDAYRQTGRAFFEPGQATGDRVAIVGAGPAGLACAAELRRAGIAVTLFEARDRPGGLATHAIVPWRHAGETTEAEAAEVERAGVVLRTGVRVGEGVAPTELLRDFDALFLATGLGRSRRLGIPGEDLPDVLDALEVLEAVVAGRGMRLALGPRVGVIGGGSTAMDAAAAAVKLGCADVTLFYRRSEAEAPAHPAAIALARALGVRLRWLASPAEIVGSGGRVSAVRFDAMRLGRRDRSGRRSAHVLPGAGFAVELDNVIAAVGQEGLETLLDGLGVVHRGGLVRVDRATGRTSHPRIWAGGDLASGGREVVDAVEDGKIAARSIAAALADRAARRPPSGPRVVAVRPSMVGRPGSAGALAVEMAGIRSPNPFWLASGPPTNTGEMVARAFEAGWGGAVWKTVGEPITNVTSRLGSFDLDGRRIAGLSNIELISDRPIETNLAEVREIKRRFPDRAVVISLMVESRRKAWHEIVRRVNDTGADAIELNCGCPHGMAERGMGAAVGQVPEYLAMITGWAKEVSRVPVLVKLTPNITDITAAARAAHEGGADGIALINTINSLVGIDLQTWRPRPEVRGMGTHGGYSGPAVKPIALHMVSACARDPRVGIPISGIGGIGDWRDAAEFLLLGATTVQVCTAVLQRGYGIVADLIDGLTIYLGERGVQRPADIVGRALPAITEWGRLDLSYRLVARIDPDRCIRCGVCYRSCQDGAHQAIRLERTNGRATPVVVPDACVGCHLCEYVCPVRGCVSMVEVGSPDRVPVAAG